MFAEAVVAAELLGAVAWTLQGPRSFRSLRTFATAPATSPPSVTPAPDGTYTLPPVVITPDAPAPSETCKAKIDAFVAKLPEETREIIRQAIVLGNPMQIDAVATEVEKVDPELAACLRAQKKT